MNNSTKSIIAIIILLAIIVFLGWFFWDILLYMFIAIVLSIMGSPLMRLLKRIHIGKWQFPDALAAAITLLVILAVIITACYYIIPVIVRQITLLAAIDPSNISLSFEKWVNNLDPLLRRFGFINKHDHTFNHIMEEVTVLLQQVNFSSLLSNTFSMLGTIFIATFSILFMTFFSLKEHNVFFKMIKRWLPKRYHQNFDNILDATGKQLSSYFLGVFMEMVIVGIIEIVLGLILRVPNAIAIGTIGGLLNIIPYVGPLIAALIGIVLSISSIITNDMASSLMMITIVKVVSVFCVAKLIDDFVLQPYIYGKRTHTHPLEIFVVIMMAGYLGGVFAMIFAVPAYTLLRIVINEFFGTYFANPDEGEDKAKPLPPEASTISKEK